MKLEDQVCDPQLAEKLKALGIAQNALFTWNAINRRPLLARTSKETDYLDGASAFTVAELGEILPKCTTSYKVPGKDNAWMCVYDTRINNKTETKRVVSTLEANARASMLIYLIENGQVKP